MAFQLLSISCLSLTIVFPQSLIIVIQQIGGPDYSEFGVEAMIHFVQYSFIFANVVLPFVILNSLPNLKRKLIS